MCVCVLLCTTLRALSFESLLSWRQAKVVKEELKRKAKEKAKAGNSAQEGNAVLV